MSTPRINCRPSPRRCGSQSSHQSPGFPAEPSLLCFLPGQVSLFPVCILARACCLFTCLCVPAQPVVVRLNVPESCTLGRETAADIGIEPSGRMGGCSYLCSKQGFWLGKNLLGPSILTLHIP
jgi:hypothetical protein